MKQTISVIEDEPHLGEMLRDMLGARWQLEVHTNLAAAERALSTSAPDLIIVDVKLPDGDGIEWLERWRVRDNRSPVIVMTAFATVDRAVLALKAGAIDFLVKPFSEERLLAAVESAFARSKRLAEVEFAAPRVLSAASGIVGESAVLRELLDVLPRVAASASTVLIRGESGTGKELVARAIHEGSPRLDGPFVALNCAAISPGLLEAELFGFERGAFTGAHAQRKGFVESADGGTLFLDEIGDMSLEAQSRLLRVLQESEIVRVGGREPVGVDVRVIAATHQPLESLVEAGRFRQDLLYRLSVVPIEIPPLRSRADDIPGLIAHFLDSHAAKGRAVPAFPSAEVIARLKAHVWPGNVRELENWVERAVVFGRFTPEDLERTAPVLAAPVIAGEAEVSDAASAVVPLGVRTLKEAVGEAERAAVVAALSAAGGNKAQAARLLGVSYKTLFNKIHEHGIKESARFE